MLIQQRIKFGPLFVIVTVALSALAFVPENQVSDARAALSAATAAQEQRVFINRHWPIRGQDGRPVLSPPHVGQTDECSKSVYVDSFVPHATITVFLSGTTVIGGPVATQFGFAAVPLTQALHAGDHITATQTVNGVTSEQTSPPMIVGKMPATLPAPTIDPKIYACGRVVPVHNLAPGVTVEVRDLTAGAVIGSGATPNLWGSDWVPVVTSPLVAGHMITARQAACTGVRSPEAAATTVQPEPAPVNAPTLDTPIIGNDAITAHGLYTGSLLKAFQAGLIGSGFSTGESNFMRVAPPIAASPGVTAEQDLCSHSPGTPPQNPTDKIPPPTLFGPICPNQPAVIVRNTTINATLVLLKNGVVVGYGGAAFGDVPLDIAPPYTFGDGDKVKVIEYIGGLVTESNTVNVNCSKQNVVTQHNNNSRTGAQLAEKTLTAGNVNSRTFGLLYDRHVLGTMLAQPLYVHDVRTGRGLKNLIYVATAEDIVYAFDADDTSPDTTVNVNVRGDMVPESTKWIWRRALGKPHVNDICGETVPPAVGVTSTPVIDVSAGVMYVVAREQRDDPTMGHDYIHALDIETGAALRERQVTATDPVNGFTFNDKCQRQRPGLLLQNGVVYLGYGTYNCDQYCPGGEPYRGWIIGFRASDFAPAGAFTNSKRPDEGGMGVWASGNGLAGSEDGSIFYETGNDLPSGGPLAMLGDSFVKLHGDGSSLTLASHYQPPFASNYKSGDTDLGAGGPMLLPRGKLIGGGKDGRFFVLSQSDLAASPVSFQAFYNTFHFGPGPYPYNSPTVYPTPCPPNSVFGVANEGQPCYIDPGQYKNGESFGPNIHAGPVFWQDSARHGFIYKMSEKDYLKAFDYDLSTGAVNRTPALVATVRPAKDGMPGGFSSVSADGRRDAIVWTVVQQDNSMMGYPKPALLYAHDAKTLSELWNNDADRVALAKFNPPTIADGLVILPSVGVFQVYGLTKRTDGGIRHLSLEEAMLRRWLNTGGPQGFLGHPVTKIERDSRGGLRQDFETIVDGGGYGQISVPPSVRIELPMCDSRVTYKPSLRIMSSLYGSQKTGVHFVIGEIRRLYLESGGPGRFGYPLTDEVPTPDGFGLMTRFENGTIFWYPGRYAEIGEPKTPPLHVIPRGKREEP